MAPILESAFGFLFKYRPFVFAKGSVAFGTPVPELVVLLGAAALVVLVLTYVRAPGELRRRDRVVLTTLRASAVAVLVLVLLRPMLVVATVVPQQNFLAVLVDDSRSMQIGDVDGQPRSAKALEVFGPGERSLIDELATRFKLRFFRFAETTERVAAVSDLGFAGPRTDIAQALERARQELDPVPLAGLVVVSDGADNSESGLTEALLHLKARTLPVYTVGLGRDRFPHDIAIGRVETPRSVLEGATLVVEVHVTQSGYGGKSVTLQVESEGRIVSAQDVVLPRGGETVTVPVQFPAAETGPRLFRFHIPQQPGELVTENNSREVLIVVEDARQKILYFEGEPRWEVKFLRAAVADDENLQLVVLQRTAETKFSRLDVDSGDELAAGFPTTREELFSYRGLILGSIEASFFTQDQLRMIAEFVSQRGGGLLMLGGRRSFAEGGYGATAVADALPVVIEAEASTSGERRVIEVRAEATPVGLLHPAMQIAPSLEAASERWSSLPPLTTVNAVREVKPGATTLLRGVAADGGAPVVLLASQRYGRGRALAFPVQDSWLWQMHAEIPLDDLTHETFWQQLLRWLVSGVPDRVTVTAAQDRVAIGSSVALTAEVADSAYLKVNGATVLASIQSPSGIEHEVPMAWTVETDGTYKTQIVTNERGLYTVRVEARQGDSLRGASVGYMYAADPDDEYFDAELHAGLLERIAAETGGRYYTPATVAALPDDVQYTESGTTVREELDLWDMPLLFLMLIGLVAAEWGYRRVSGLV